nr:hypothetical protein [uncultured Noviherbaspirillum sp.]
MQAYSFNADIPNYYQAGVPVSVPDDSVHEGLHDKLLPQELLKQKSAEQIEIERHAYYFRFADDAQARLESRGLWTKKDGSQEFEARPDAREKLVSSFSGFLTSFVNFGSNNDAARPRNVCSGIVQYAQSGMSPMMAITGAIFVFSTIVSHLKTAFPEQKTYLDQSGLMTYFSSSAAHAIVSGIQPVIQEALHSHADPIFAIVLVSIELLLGFYRTVTATESSLSGQSDKSKLLTKLINAKSQAKSFFEKIQKSETPGPEEAEAYEKFMALIVKLDQISGEARFASLVSAASAAKEWLWFGGSVVGNETAYKSLISTEIAVSNIELLGTALGKLFLSLVANVADFVQGIVVAFRCQQKIDHGIGLGKQLGVVSNGMTLPDVAPLIKGLARLIGKMVENEEFEKGFAIFRIFKACLLIAIGIASIVAIALSLVYAAPLILGLTAGVVLASFFVFLIARSIRTVDGVKEDEQEKEQFKKLLGVSDIEAVDFNDFSESATNKLFLLHVLSISFVDTPDRWEKGADLLTLLAALNFNKIDIALLKSLSRNTVDREKNISMVKTQLTRMLDLKIIGA